MNCALRLLPAFCAALLLLGCAAPRVKPADGLAAMPGKTPPPAAVKPISPPPAPAAPQFPFPALPELENFHEAAPGVWRSGQPTETDFATLEKAGLKSVVNLRFYHDDKAAAAKTNLQLLRVPMNAGTLTEKQLLAAVKALRDAPKPVLLHCWHGADRTGAVVAAYRIAVESKSVDDALAELADARYGFHSVYSNIPKLLRTIDWAVFRRRLK